MPHVVREIPHPPDVSRLARALAAAPGLAVLQSGGLGGSPAGDARFSFVACDPVERSHAWVPPEGERARGWGGFPAAPRWIGVVPYEAARGIERPAWTRTPDLRPAPPIARPTWQRYDAVVRIDHARGIVAIEADDAAAADRLARALDRDSVAGALVTLTPMPAIEPDAAHLDRVREVLRLIARGDVYQANVARCLEHTLRGRPFDAYEAIFRASPAPYGFFADLGSAAVCASSPELALEARGAWLRTSPIKGTRPRGTDAETDEALARELDRDPKERAELTMAVDLHRNDLGRIAEIGSVRVLGEPRVHASRTVWSRSASIVAKRREGVSLDAIVRAMIPCGSVTGAPKVRAMEIIAAREPFRRGLYTGAFGYVGRDGGLVLAMAIRTLEVAAPLGTSAYARYCTGGGIVADSDPERELQETRWKATPLFALLPPFLHGNT